MTTHDLKTWPEFYIAIENGDMTFELRKDDDRGFRVGDFLRLKEWLPSFEKYTGRQMVVQVSYLMAGPAFGIEARHVCMAIHKTDL